MHTSWLGWQTLHDPPLSQFCTHKPRTRRGLLISNSLVILFRTMTFTFSRLFPLRIKPSPILFQIWLNLHRSIFYMVFVLVSCPVITVGLRGLLCRGKERKCIVRTYSSKYHCHWLHGATKSWGEQKMGTMNLLLTEGRNLNDISWELSPEPYLSKWSLVVHVQDLVWI